MSSNEDSTDLSQVVAPTKDIILQEAPLWKILSYAVLSVSMVFSISFVMGMLLPMQLVTVVVCSLSFPAKQKPPSR